MKTFIPNTLQEAIQYFSDPEVCIQTLAAMRWPNGVECPACGCKEHYYLKTQRRWKCRDCWKQFSAKLGTVMEDSPIPLQKWLPALWLLINCKNGISSYELGKDLKVSQKSAWFMLQRLRLVLQDGSLVKLPSSGAPVEIDETFIGGKARNMHKSKRQRLSKQAGGLTGGNAKSIVMGMLQRGGKVRAMVIPERKRPIVQQIVRDCIEPGANIHTDEAGCYLGLSEEYVHEIINHMESYVRGHVSTNGIENFWSLLKRSLSGTYVSVEPFHLFRYIDEQAWRFNNRSTRDKKVTDADRFALALSQVAGKRLTFAQVTGKGEIREAF
ncbi:MAG: IS1595 family transposase [Candidatus Korobacteraceae bacterium]|jgi:transposase-like protein